MSWIMASEACASRSSCSRALYLSRKAWAAGGREEAPFSFAIMVQVAKSALALVSARRAIIMSAALIKMASASLRRVLKFGIGLCIAGDDQYQPDHITGRGSQYRRNNIKI